MPDWDLVVVGHETEGCLAAIAGATAGARTALVAPEGALLGGLLTEDGLAFVDRDARHLIPPDQSPHDGLFGQFLARAGVPLVALDAHQGDATLRAMLAEAGVTLIHGVPEATDEALSHVALAGGEDVSARFWIDATPDLDLAELAGMRFATAFEEYGDHRALGVSPLPVVEGVSPEQILATCRQLQANPALEARRQEVFGSRAFLELEHGDDYVLVGPPHLGLAYQIWRESHIMPSEVRFEADGFNVAVLGPRTTSWNGLMYFVNDAAERLRLSREGMNAFFRDELHRFERFLHGGLGWTGAKVHPPKGIYVRQTRHALDVKHRLTLDELAGGYDASSVGSFCYYPDFRGFHTPRVPGPLTAHVILEAGLSARHKHLGLASRAAGYTPFAHSLCRLVQYNATMGVALGVAAALAKEDLGAVSSTYLKAEMARLGFAADDPAGFERNEAIQLALRADPVIAHELKA